MEYSLFDGYCCEDEAIQLKSVIFETTYIDDAAIIYKCNIGGSYCMGCNSLSFVYIQVNDPTQFDKCTNACPTSTYADYAGSCQPCHSLCLKCTSDSNSSCSECKAAIGLASLLGTSCKCKEGYFYQDPTNLCQKCYSPLCQSCTSGLINGCNECKTFIGIGSVSNSQCSCLNGYVLIDDASLCQKCFDTICIECQTIEKGGCLKCEERDGVEVFNGECQCMKGYFYKDDFELCVLCFNLCSKCFGSPVNCSECQAYEGVEAGPNMNCICSQGFYLDAKINLCLPCHSSCLNCAKSDEFSCNQCLPEMILYPNKVGSCFYNCTTINGIIECKLCILQDCALCNATHCLKCNQSFILFNSKDGISSCISSCPSKQYYLDKKSFSCKECFSECWQCHGPKSNQCVACFKGSDINQGSCIKIVCPQSMYMNSETGICDYCDFTCNSCIGPGSSQCQVCGNERILTEINNDHFCLLCSEIDPHTEYDTATQSCSEICGDGINGGMYECDDGNAINGDGCSSKCKIEKGWDCPHITGSADLCKNIIPIKIKNFKVQKGSKFTIVFSKMVKILNYVGVLQIKLIKSNSSQVFTTNNITINSLGTFSKMIKGNFTIDAEINVGDVII